MHEDDDSNNESHKHKTSKNNFTIGLLKRLTMALHRLEIFN